MYQTNRQLTIKETQRIALGVLDELDRFCKNKGIDYYLLGGSLIGAVRDHDLVPWDDDIDVAMKREDYERFCREYQNSEQFKLLSYRRGDNYRHGMAKLIDNRTIFIEQTTKDEAYGVFVDIFPLDRVASPDDVLVKSMMRRVRIYNYSHVINSEATKSNVIKTLARIVLSHTIGLRSFVKDMDTLVAKMVSGSGDYLINFWGAWGIKECVPAECFADSVPVTLQGKNYPAPVGYDFWLTNVYGDYMSPPKKPPHYHGRAYLKSNVALDEDNEAYE